jgi:drug/metabolite transporter (DMT)-like permease
VNNQKKAYLYAGIAIFFWSTVASAFKIGLENISVVQFLFFATLTSFLIYLIINALNGNLKSLRSLKSRDLLFGAGMGLLNPFVYYLVLFKAYEILPAQVAQPLNMVWPIILVFLSVGILKQKFRWISMLSLLICFVGVYLISSQGDPGSFRFHQPLGVALALGSSIMWAFYWILNVKRGGDETLLLLLNFFFAAIYISLLMVMSNGFQELKPLGVGLAVYSGAFEMGITFLLWIRAMKLSQSNDRISNLVYLAPFLSLVFIHFFVGETIFVTSVAGLTLIIAGIIIEKIRLF